MQAPVNDNKINVFGLLIQVDAICKRFHNVASTATQFVVFNFPLKVSA